MSEKNNKDKVLIVGEPRVGTMIDWARLQELSKERILCAAIWFKDGKKYDMQPVNIDSGYITTGYRHGECYTHVLIFEADVEKLKKTSGFLTSKNRFVDREEGFKIAKDVNQLIDSNAGPILISEDLY